MLQGKTWKRHNRDWPQITGHSYRIIITDGSGSGEEMHYLI